jgi:hypothetical protein
LDIYGKLCGKISAINLKEIEVKFNNKVDKTTAENKDAYVLTKGIGLKGIDAASLQEDGKTVILTVTDPALTNQANDYKLSIANVKSATGESTFSQKDIAFKPLDVTFPTVENVASLGNKAVKVTFTEPVQKPASVASTFKIDGVVASGLMDSTGRTITITLFNKLTDGEHNLTINSNIKDYANYQLVETTVPFTVTEDTVAPTIVEAKDVTLEGATIVFSEDVKKAEAETATNYYWKQGAAVKSASSAKLIDGKTVRITFASTNRLPGYATDLFVKNVVDYSGNKIAADSKVAVTAVLDQTKPEVLTYKFDNDAKTMVLTFSKPVNLSSFNASNVAIKDEDAKAVSNGYTAVTPLSNDGKTLTIKLTKKLPVGTFSFEFLGMKDTTLLENPMMPFSTTLEVKDSTKPTALSLAGTGTTYILTFDKAMDISTSYSILNPQNYFVTYTTNDDPVRTISGLLPEGTNLSPTNGNKGVIIQLPYGVTSLKKLSVQGVKDADGNFLKDYAHEFTSIENTVTITKAEATDKETIVLTMNQSMKYANKANFVVNKAEDAVVVTDKVSIADAKVDDSNDTKVILTLDASTPLTADAKNTDALEVSTTGDFTQTQGLTDVNLAAIADGSGIAVEDAIAPSAKIGDPAKVAVPAVGTGAGLAVTDSVSDHTIKVIFDEPIKAVNSEKLDENFKVEKADGMPLECGIDYMVSVLGSGDNVATISLVPTTDDLKEYAGSLRVVFDNSNGNIIDASENENAADGFDTKDDVADADKSKIKFTEETAPVATIPTTTGANNSGTKLVLTFSEGLYKDGIAIADNADVKSLFTYSGTADNYKSATYDADAKTVTFVFAPNAEDTKTLTVATGTTFKDAVGNAYASETITYATTGTVWTK